LGKHPENPGIPKCGTVPAQARQGRSNLPVFACREKNGGRVVWPPILFNNPAATWQYLGKQFWRGNSI
jgi:hypothetical protein